MEYIAAILGFIATYVGIRGHTWDQKRRKITRLGWAAISVAAISMVVSGVLAYRSKKAADWQEQQRAKVRLIAQTELRAALNTELTVLEWLWQDIIASNQRKAGSTYELDYDFKRFRVDPDYMASVLTDSLFHDAMKYMKLIDPPEDPIGLRGIIHAKSWEQVLCVFSAEADSSFEKVLTKYAVYLSAEDLVKVHEFRHDPFFQFALHGSFDEYDPLSRIFFGDYYREYVARLADLMRRYPYGPSDLIEKNRPTTR